MVADVSVTDWPATIDVLDKLMSLADVPTVRPEIISVLPLMPTETMPEPLILKALPALVLLELFVVLPYMYRLLEPAAAVAADRERDSPELLSVMLPETFVPPKLVFVPAMAPLAWV